MTVLDSTKEGLGGGSKGATEILFVEWTIDGNIVAGCFPLRIRFMTCLARKDITKPFGMFLISGFYPSRFAIIDYDRSL